jgi:MFS transporter, DHA1 family, multidrug resistance protein
VRSSGWQVNVAAVWVAEVLAVGGYFVMYPLLPLFLAQDLSVHAGSSLALWAGLATGLSGLCMAVVSPAWGATADRFGRHRVFIAVVLLSALTTAASISRQTQSTWL